jgi:hypothetical protein
VQVQILRDVAADADAADAVPGPVERRREDADPELSGKDVEHAAGDAALRRQPDVEEPAARAVVHAAGGHHAQHAADRGLGGGALARHRVQAAVGERGRDQREVAAVDDRRALLEVELEHRLRVVADDRGRAQQVADRAVAVARGALGLVDRPVDRHRVTRVAGVGGQQAVERAVAGGAREEGDRGDRADVDHRVERQAGFRREAEGVEGLAGRLDADQPANRLLPEFLEREPVGQRLRDRLDREGPPRVPDLVDGAVASDEADPEPVRVGLGELGDVRRDVALVQMPVARMEAVEIPLDGRVQRRRRLPLGCLQHAASRTTKKPGVSSETRAALPTTPLRATPPRRLYPG